MKNKVRFKNTEIGEIPVGWEVKPAEEFCLRVTDGTHDSPQKQTVGKFLITSRHLKKGHLDFDNAYFISEGDFIEANKRSKVDRWDVIFSMIGTIGEIYLEKNQDINYAIKNVGLFKAGEELKGKWLYYYFQSPEAKRYIHRSRGGTTQEYMTLESLRKFPIVSSSDIHEMRRIIDILDSIQDKIELNRQMNKTLESISRAIFKRWFVEFEFPGYENTKIINGLPDGWHISKLGDFAEILNGFAFKSEDFVNLGIFLLRTRNFTEDGYIVRDDTACLPESFYDEYKSFRLKKFDVLLVMVGASVGKMAIVQSSVLPALQNQNMWNFRSKSGSGQLFLNFLVKKIVQENMGTASGSARDFFRKDYFRSIDFILPNENILKDFNKQVVPIFDRIDKNLAEIQILSQIRDSLLPRLMSGRIRVKFGGKFYG